MPPTPDGGHVWAIVPKGVWSYWDNWWVKCEEQRGIDKDNVLIVSRRTGKDADYDARILVDRLASGLHWGVILTSEPDDKGGEQ